MSYRMTEIEKGIRIGEMSNGDIDLEIDGESFVIPQSAIKEIAGYLIKI